MTGCRAFNARYIGLVLPSIFPGCKFYLAEDGHALAVKAGRRLAGLIMRVQSSQTHGDGSSRA